MAAFSEIPGSVQTVEVNGITIAYEEFGDSAATPLLLVMGLGAQMLTWREAFCQELADRGFRVIRFDNRDVGLSTHLHDAPVPDAMGALSGDFSTASYTLSDLAADAVGLLDALGIAAAHIVGASMGGMIGQTIAIEHPAKTLSLTSIMSTTGNPTVGGATAEATAVLLAPPPGDRAGAIEKVVHDFSVIGSPGFPYDADGVREITTKAYDRAYDPLGVMRQMLAIFASGDRTAQLADVTIPTVVIHGEDDPLVNVSGGEATAAAIPGAMLLTIPGMGHDLPVDVWPQVIGAIATIAEK